MLAFKMVHTMLKNYRFESLYFLCLLVSLQRFFPILIVQIVNFCVLYVDLAVSICCRSEEGEGMAMFEDSLWRSMSDCYRWINVKIVILLV